MSETVFLLTGRHVLALMGAFFGVIFAVSGTFLYLAFTTYPGGATAPYQRGLHYNRTVAEAARQDALGWRVTADYRDGRLVVALIDSGGQPLSGERVAAEIGRPATSRFDRQATLAEEARGTYAAPVPLAPGYWDVAVKVNAGGDGTPFNETLRVWIGDRS